MPRIRTIKPEFPQSESIGALSRDARLLFLLLFTIVDDAGRTRAASRMLASLLYPYDGDISVYVTEWLEELETKGRVVRYEVAGARYLEIVNWLEHQKIDRPSASRLPPPPGVLASPREDSRALDADLNQDLNLGPRIVKRPEEEKTEFEGKKVKYPFHMARATVKGELLVYLKRGTPEFDAYMQDIETTYATPAHATADGRWFKWLGEQGAA